MLLPCTLSRAASPKKRIKSPTTPRGYDLSRRCHRLAVVAFLTAIPSPHLVPRDSSPFLIALAGNPRPAYDEGRHNSLLVDQASNGSDTALFARDQRHGYNPGSGSGSAGGRKDEDTDGGSSGRARRRLEENSRD